MKFSIVPRITTTLRTRWPHLLVGLVLFTAIALATVYVTMLADLPAVSLAAQRIVPPTTTILDRNGQIGRAHV